MNNDNGFILPELPDLTPSIEDLPQHVRKFKPDYKFASNEMLKTITVNYLAKLESDLHNLRIIYFANGENPGAVLGNGRLLTDEINSTTELLDKLSTYFETILNSGDGVA